MISFAGAYTSLPGCDAFTFTMPACPVRLRTLPLIVAGPSTMLYCTGRPELAVASSSNGFAVVNLLEMAGKLINWYKPERSGWRTKILKKAPVPPCEWKNIPSHLVLSFLSPEPGVSCMLTPCTSLAGIHSPTAPGL
ncbi:MAG: hypothetical protein BWY72_02268 [Bacteroidetes bacterium ADurb.Bin416]|nr:MAG: hypothetical protein BWY72_02268 [Bacteroidetes bacterium ADurb.Bin416]